jgi:sialic acid synthase SpsE
MKDAGIRIQDRRYAAGGPVYVIAEIGSNHDGSLDRAIEMIAAAASVGADAAKFQLFTARGLAAPRCERLQDAFTPHALPREWLPDLAAAADEHGIDFIATPFDLPAVEALAAMQSPAIKIASGDLTYHALLRAAAATGLPIIVSSGAANLRDVESSLDVLRREGVSELALLHCVSGYPPRFDELTLCAIPSLRQALAVTVGFSDHTPGIAASIAAVTLGSAVIEKHLTLDRTLQGPDHPFAMEPREFGELVQGIRAVEVALGDGVKQPAASEADERYWAWRGLYAARDLNVGHVLGHDDIVGLRPREGVGADDERLVVGRPLLRELRAGDAVTLEDV